jgi:hypothetical protein
VVSCVLSFLGVGDEGHANDDDVRKGMGRGREDA